MEAKRTRATSINPIYVRLPPWVSRLDTDAITRRIVQGLFRTQKIVRLLSDIPCDIIHTLENDATEAKAFVDDIEQGKVPKIIANLPKEVTGAISDLLHIFLTLPTEIVDVAEATITGAVNVFNDIESGAIVDDLKKLPGVIVSDITNAWGDLTSGLEDDWNAATHAIACAFVHCPVTTTAAGRSCGGTQSTAAKTSIKPSLPSRSSASLPLSTSKFSTQTRPKSSSSPISSQSPQLFSSTSDSSSTPALNAAGALNIDRTIIRLNLFQLCWILGLMLLGAIFLL